MGESAKLIKQGYLINDRFEIREQLGSGGFATVFKGLDRRLSREVAIKVLHGAVIGESAHDQDLLVRFEREAKFAANVQHPCIVNIFDTGVIEGIGEPFIVMEYLQGRALDEQLIEASAMEASKIVPLFVDMLVGLGFVHEAGIVHKDLKPGNIFYRYPGTMRESLCIVDFGIAHIGRSDSQRVTRAGEFYGTPAYMSPEYISVQSVSPQLDVYQCALILIECLTGQPAVEHEDPMIMLMKHIGGDLRVPDALKQSAAWAVLERAVAIEPEERYADALEFASALKALPASAWPEPDALRLEPLRSRELLDASWLDSDVFDSDSKKASRRSASLWLAETDLHTHGPLGDSNSSPMLPLGDIEPARKPETKSRARHTGRQVGVLSPADVTGPGEPERVRARVDAETPTRVDPAPITNEPVPRTGRAAMIGGALALVLLGAGLAVVASRSLSEGAPSGAPAVIEVDMGAAEAISGSEELAKPSQNDDNAGAEKSVRIELTTTPAHASVFTERGEYLGEAPFFLRVSSGSSRTFVLKKGGYKDRRVVIDHTMAPRSSQVLEPAAAPAKEKPREKKPKGKDRDTEGPKIELPN